MKKVDYFIPVIVIILISILAVLLYNNKYKSVDLELSLNDIEEELNLDLKDIKKKYGEEDKLNIFDATHNICYCYNEAERCYSIGEDEKVIGIIITNDYKNITVDNNKINDTFESIVKNSGEKEIHDTIDNDCIRKSLNYEYDNYKIMYSSNLYCNKDDIDNIDYILITKN